MFNSGSHSGASDLMRPFRPEVCWNMNVSEQILGNLATPELRGSLWEGSYNYG